MKTRFILFLLMFAAGIASGQVPFVSCTLDFETNQCWEGTYLGITFPGTNNIWNICTPNKSIFDSAYSSPHAILTDSTGPYPLNNTSSFVVEFARIPECMCAPSIGGYYKFDSDSLKDYGKIEFTTDHGLTWYDLLSDTTPFIEWMGPKPVLTGRIHQWTFFHALLPAYDVDTIYYRYTFISDSIETNQEGWMLDNLALLDHTEGIEKLSSGNLNLYPNPTHDSFTVESKYNGDPEVSVYSVQGQLLLHEIIQNNDKVDISHLNQGMYVVKVLCGDKVLANKIVKN